MMTTTTHAISIRELQRNAAEVLGRVEHGERYIVTRRGREVGQLIPPDPGDVAIRDAIEAGILDEADLSRVRTAAEVARILPEKTLGPDPRPASSALAKMRAEERY